MTAMEDKVRTAFNAVHAPESVLAATRAAIEEARAAEANEASNPERIPPAATAPAPSAVEAAKRARAQAAEESERKAKSARPERKRIPRWAVLRIAAAACLAVALAAGGTTAVYASESAAVEVTTSGTVTLALNCFNRVIDASATDEEGAVLLEGANVVGLSYEEAVDRLLAANANAGASNESHIELVVTTESAAQRSYLNETGESCLSHHGGSYACTDATEEEVAEAAEAGMGIARYRAYQELSALDSSITLEECQGYSLHTMRAMIAELTGVASSEGAAQGNGRASDEAEHGHGNGSSNESGQGNGAGNGNGQANGSGQMAGTGGGAGHGAHTGSGHGQQGRRNE